MRPELLGNVRDLSGDRIGRPKWRTRAGFPESSGRWQTQFAAPVQVSLARSPSAMEANRIRIAVACYDASAGSSHHRSRVFAHSSHTGRQLRSAALCKHRKQVAAEGHAPQRSSLRRKQTTVRIVGCACSAGSVATWCRHTSHRTICRTWVAAALPSVIGRPGSDFKASDPIAAFWPSSLAAVRNASAAAMAPASVPAGSSRGWISRSGRAATAGSGHRQSSGAAVPRARRFLGGLDRAS